MILLDTHVLVWLASGSERLGKRTRAVLDRALADDTLACASISFWEVALLIHRNRLRLGISVETLRDDLLRSGVREIPLAGDVAIAATHLDTLHADPADRFIIATAIAHGASLVTADSRILEWRGRLRRQNAAL